MENNEKKKIPWNVEDEGGMEMEDDDTLKIKKEAKYTMERVRSMT